MAIEIRLLQPGDEGVLTRVAPDVFDNAVDTAATSEFLADPRHHLAVAIDAAAGDAAVGNAAVGNAGVVIGFASAIHYLHPDKPQPEMWINEVGVAPAYQGQGIGKALLHALLEAARTLGCREAWVLTERGNQPAMRLYVAAGGTEADEETVMFNFCLESRDEETGGNKSAGPTVE